MDFRIFPLLCEHFACVCTGVGVLVYRLNRRTSVESAQNLYCQVKYESGQGREYCQVKQRVKSGGRVLSGHGEEYSQVRED